MDALTIESLTFAGLALFIITWFMRKNDKNTMDLRKSVDNQTLVMLYVIEVVSSCPSNKCGTKKREKALNGIREDILNNKKKEGSES